MPAGHRVTQHLIVMAERRGFEKGLAARARGMGRSSITPYVNVFREPDLGVLGECGGIRRLHDGTGCVLRSAYRFEGHDAAVVRALRTWPVSVTQSLARFTVLCG